MLASLQPWRSCGVFLWWPLAAVAPVIGWLSAGSWVEVAGPVEGTGPRGDGGRSRQGSRQAMSRAGRCGCPWPDPWVRGCMHHREAGPWVPVPGGPRVGRVGELGTWAGTRAPTYLGGPYPAQLPLQPPHGRVAPPTCPAWGHCCPEPPGRAPPWSWRLSSHLTVTGKGRCWQGGLQVCSFPPCGSRGPQPFGDKGGHF